ncbi:MAG: DUF4176 domain-containing protein [Lachnospiraceae bacterium]|nr:DUF4176 domain-containing protein [Lachnospiraceae bacterium]
MERVLPLGSVVTLKSGNKKLMIVSRAPLYNNRGTIGYFDYSAYLYPTGQADEQAFFFNEEDIEEVHFEGYRDEDEERFCEIYNEMIAKCKYPHLRLERKGEELSE